MLFKTLINLDAMGVRAPAIYEEAKFSKLQGSPPIKTAVLVYAMSPVEHHSHSTFHEEVIWPMVSSLTWHFSIDAVLPYAVMCGKARLGIVHCLQLTVTRSSNIVLPTCA